MVVGSASSVDVSTLLGLTRFLTDTLENVAAFSDANILAFINISQREEQAFILSEVMYDWKENTVEGTGVGLINTVAGTNSHAFPTGLITIDRVEVNYTGNTNGFVVASPRKLEAVDGAVANTSNNSAIEGSTSNPIYWVRDGNIYLDPVPPSSVTGGMKVHASIVTTDLIVGTGATSTPAMATPYHQVLAYQAALRYLSAKEQMNKATTVKNQLNELRGAMIKFYSRRQSDDKPRLVTKVRNMR